MVDRQDQEIERRFDRDRGYDSERFVRQGRDYGQDRHDRGNEHGSERQTGNYGGHSGSGGYSGSQAGYTEPRGGFRRDSYDNFGREAYANEGSRGGYQARDDWQSSEPSRGNQGWFEGNESRGRTGNTTTTQNGEREQNRQYSGPNWGQPGWGGGIGAYSGSVSGEQRGNYGGGLSSYGQTQAGRHAGRGPKSYQRSDDRIKEDINERLTQHADVDATEIDVEIKQGEVTLRGTVENRHEKRIAEDIAENVFGVKDVKNEIRVQSRQAAGSGTQQTAFTGGQTRTAKSS